MSNQIDLYFGTPDALESLIERFRTRYGSFETDIYKTDERAYKVEAGERMRERLGRDRLRELIDLGHYEEAKTQIKRAYQGNNLLNQYDVRPIVDAPAEQLVRRLYDLLYVQDAASFGRRFDDWVDVLGRKNSRCWPAATFFLMFHDPQQHLYVKPTPYRSLLSSLYSAIEWNAQPNAQTYKQLQALGAHLLEQLRPLGARDMIDVQSFIWVVQDRDAVPDKEDDDEVDGPNAWIFKSSPDIYNLLAAFEKRTTISWSVKQHREKIRSGDTVYFWESGDTPGVVAVTRVLTDPEMMLEDEEERIFYQPGKQQPNEQAMRVRLAVDEILPRPLLADQLKSDDVLRNSLIFRQKQATNYSLTDEEAARLAQLVEIALIDDEPTDEEARGFTSVAAWHASVKTNNLLARRIADEYPTWVTTTFGERATLHLRKRQRLGIGANGRKRLHLHFNLNVGVYVRLLEASAADVAFVREHISDPNNLWDLSGIYRFRVETEADYDLLKDVTRRIVGTDTDVITWPEKIDGPTFVLIHGGDWDEQQYGVSYAFDSKAGGARSKLIEALHAFQNGSPPVLIVLYRPGPRFAFTAWARVRSFSEFPGNNDTNTRWVLQLDHHEFPNAVNVRALVKQVSFLNRGLAIAFRGVSIRRTDLTDFQTIIDAARLASGESLPMTMAEAAYLILSEETDALALSTIFERIQDSDVSTSDGPLSTSSLLNALQNDPRFVSPHNDFWMLNETIVDPPIDSNIWRIHFPRSLWEQAHEHGVIGIDWPIDSTNRSVNYFKRIKIGDLVVVYMKNGMIGSVGVVTEPFFDIRIGNTDRSSADVFNGEYAQRIRVRWHDELPTPVELKEQLQEPENTKLYNRLKYTHTVVPMPADEYVTLLNLLQVPDAVLPTEEPSHLPTVWTRLATYRDFMRSLPGEQWDADALYTYAQAFGQDFAADADAEDLVLALRQLRLIRSAGPSMYEPQPYVEEGNGLVPLMALGVLVSIEGTEDTFELPARKMISRLLAATDPQPLDTFAPELGPDGPRLLEWYAEGGILVITDGQWWTDGQIPTLPPDNLVDDEYNLLRQTLLAERDGTLATDISHADGALPRSPDFSSRLAELGRELLIDDAVVRRVYRSLLAGRHVVLSGPPGTGKTELAKRLPSLLWREAPQLVTRLGTDLDSTPVVVTSVTRQGYAALVITATEDWGVRDVVGGIAPRLDGNKGTLGYDIQYGALTRALLVHYEGTDGGRRLPAHPHTPRRQDYRAEGERYRGAWLVIDEFTRAPVDAAFGSLLTTLGGGTDAMLRVPATDGGEVSLPLPIDFRIIGTLNSFDRHFLNQISEAMKRRFDFIDVLLPAPRYEDDEQGIAAAQALRRLAANGVGVIEVDGDPPRYTFEDVTVTPIDVAGALRYRLEASGAAVPALQSFWNIFRAIRVFRQLGTAQVVAVYTNLFAGREVGMDWNEALDTALADSLADQLQVMTRDEQRILLLYITDPKGFSTALRTYNVSSGAGQGLLHTLGEAYLLLEGTPLGDQTTLATLTDGQIDGLFPPSEGHSLPRAGVFEKRLRDLIGDRGL